MNSARQLIIVSLVGLLIALASWRGHFSGLDARIYDNFFHYRHLLGWDPPIDPRIVIVELDEETFDVIGQPVSRWADDYAVVVDRLFQAGADIVGFDILFAPRLKELPPEDSHKIYGEIEQLGLLALTHDLVIIDSYRQLEGKALTSVDLLHFAAKDKQNVGYNNLLTDADGVVRALGLFFYNEEPRSTRNFVGRIAELAKESPIVKTEKGVSGLVTTGADKMLINYPGPPSLSFERLKVSDILQGQKLNGSLEDKICLLGPAFDTSNDLHNTPMNFNLASLGVEIHAAALNTILTDRYLRPPPPWSHFVFSLVGVVLAFLLALRAPPQAILGGGFLLMLSYLCLAFFAFAKAGLLVPVLAPLLATAVSGGSTAVARYRALESSRRYVKAVLGRFVSPQVMEELLASPNNLQLGGRRKRITVLFTDINNFTPQCESKSPEEVLLMLNEFFNEMLEIIFRYNGTVKQFVGDEIMVMYGAPNDMDDHAERAVYTARDMVKRLDELKALKGEKAGFYEVKVGIHTGDVVVGNVGNERRSEYAAVGDPVNTAARIEGLTKNLEEAILLSEVTLKEFGGTLTGIEFVPKGPQSFKGKADKMEVFGVRWS
ncbi:MAG: adenylate/guanylate cyclase domain-containing protein [Candidatus Eremiobacteraeota bacterium]|nr:adenylate/guanylate cyclase domain-containing protein [Candidatus Eremiobacteraeota bacterium]